MKLPKWLIIATLYSPFATAIICDPSLGTSINAQDCLIAVRVLTTRVRLHSPQDTNFNDAQVFVHNSNGDPRYSMPQGAQFGSCGVGIDITNVRSAVSSWSQLTHQMRGLAAACPEGSSTLGQRGQGGLAQFNGFSIIIVDPGQGMRNIVGTCMATRPPHTVPLHFQLTERICGFQSVAGLIPQPDTAQLPTPPALFPLGLGLNNQGWISYRVRGQWLWNTDAWSPIFGNVFEPPMITRRLLVLLSGGVPQITAQLAYFSRIIPRVMGPAWIQQPNGARWHFHGAWGARGSSIWLPVLGDMTNLQAVINRYDWVLIELMAIPAAQSPWTPGLQQARPLLAPPPHLRLALTITRELSATSTTRLLEATDSTAMALGSAAAAISDDDPSISSASGMLDDVSQITIANGSDELNDTLDSTDNQRLAMANAPAQPLAINSGSYLPFQAAQTTSRAGLRVTLRVTPSRSSTFNLPEPSITREYGGERPSKRPRPNP